ncbi:hypothetical protein S7711_06252 [Stachybotrys chartarum IBT 7711]|uniref:BZIP domain-containing protein n=1 Tax=Stachybotrys chartarum (strain CBS 109288 / IBT 7711) TaxID=1280523 RepID=A0A084B4Y7_STACB|nr:hypothetical protein S7711_06252 [Stachybotrys chartarum IBT 7711]
MTGILRFVPCWSKGIPLSLPYPWKASEPGQDEGATSQISPSAKQQPPRSIGFSHLRGYPSVLSCARTYSPPEDIGVASGGPSRKTPLNPLSIPTTSNEQRCLSHVQSWRSYRDRKDRYTKALEKELAQSRSNEARLMQESEQLRVTVQNITNLLSQHGILVPPEVDGAVLSTFNAATPGISSLESVETLPSPQLFSPESFGDYYLSSDKEISSPTKSTRHMSSAVYHSGRSVRVCELDQVVVAMEFVLKIEEPCLGHLHGDPQKPNDPTGHALTASAQLACISNHSTSATQRAYLSPPATTTPYLSAPEAMLERLLSLAPDLSCDGEITPIQAWNIIRSRPQFAGLDVQKLYMLSEALRKSVKCHGFGTVVQLYQGENHDKAINEFCEAKIDHRTLSSFMVNARLCDEKNHGPTKTLYSFSFVTRDFKTRDVVFPNKVKKDSLFDHQWSVLKCLKGERGGNLVRSGGAQGIHDRVKLSGIDRAQLLSHVYEHDKLHDCTLADWADLRHNDRVAVYTAPRDRRITHVDNEIEEAGQNRAPGNSGTPAAHVTDIGLSDSTAVDIGDFVDSGGNSGDWDSGDIGGGGGGSNPGGGSGGRDGGGGGGGDGGGGF